MTRVISRDEQPEEEAAVTTFKKRFAFPNRPSADLPELPNHLDEMSESLLMETYREFMAWVSYAKSELVKAEIDEEREANFLRVLESKVLIEQWGSDVKGDRVTIAKARRDTDKRVVTQQEAHRQSRAYRKLVESLFDRCERGAQLLSRELTRRVNAGPRDNRNARFNA
jgi:hypothetical protein